MSWRHEHGCVNTERAALQVAVALAGPSINIEPDAWKAVHAKGFPAQIPVHFVDSTSMQIPTSERFEVSNTSTHMALLLLARRR